MSTKSEMKKMICDLKKRHAELKAANDEFETHLEGVFEELNVRYEQIRIMADCDEQAMKAYAEIKKNHEIYQKQIDEMKKQSKSGEMGSGDDDEIKQLKASIAAANDELKMCMDNNDKLDKKIQELEKTLYVLEKEESEKTRSEKANSEKSIATATSFQVESVTSSLDVRDKNRLKELFDDEMDNRRLEDGQYSVMNLDQTEFLEEYFRK